MGRRQMVKLLQRASGLTGDAVDGHLGPQTYAAAQSCTPGEFREQRFLFYENLVNAQPEKYEKYRMGWLRRTMRV
jgi:lysozyme family protein